VAFKGNVGQRIQHKLIQTLNHPQSGFRGVCGWLPTQTPLEAPDAVICSTSRRTAVTVPSLQTVSHAVAASVWESDRSHMDWDQHVSAWIRPQSDVTIFNTSSKLNKVPDTTEILYSPAPVFIFAVCSNDH
jgi:phosphohistidine phosphatase SixA